MKLRKLTMTVAAITFIALLASCKKEFPNIFNMFKVKLTLHPSKAYAIGDDQLEIEINTTDSLLIDYTIESPDTDMYQVSLYKTGGTVPVQRVAITDSTRRRSFSGKFMLYARDLGAGTTSYRIWAVDKEGVYLGDGYKTIQINVLSDLKYYSNRKVFMPDSTEKVNPCYLSLKDGQLFSYSNGAANAANIDFGFYQKFELVGTVLTERLNMYSLSANPLPFTHYDISSWAKRATLFSAPVTGNATTFRTMLNTGSKIAAEAQRRPINLTSTTTTPLAANQFIYFLTPEGKYGVLFIQAFNTDYLFKRYIQLAYKIQN